MNEKFQLETLEIEGFRGINDKLKLDFNYPLVFFFGENGAGKSSILGAIEWCLFGDLAYLKCIETPHAKDELVNQNHPSGCKVTLILKSKDKKYEFSREKKLGEGGTKFKIQDESGNEVEGKKAEAECFRLLGRISHEDFSRAIYMHQEAVRGLVTESPISRDESLDRLFGLENAREIIDGIPSKEIEDSFDKLQDQKRSEEDKMKGAITICSDNFKKAKEEAEEEGIPKSKQTFSNSSEIAQEVINKLTKVTKDYKLPSHEIDIPASIPNLGTFTKKVNECLREYRKEVTKIEGIDILIKKQTNLKKLKERFEENLKDIKEDRAKLQKSEKEYGKLETIKGKIKESEKNIENLKKERNEIDAKFRVIEDAKDYFESVIKDICPVCGNKIDREILLKKLTKQIQETQAKITKDINQQIETLKTKIEEYSDAEDKIKDIYDSLEPLEEEKKDLVKEALEIIGTTIKSDEQIILNLEEKNGEIEKELKKYQKANVERERIFGEIEDENEKIKLIFNVLKKQEEYKSIESSFSSQKETINTLAERIKELSSLKHQLGIINEVITKTQENLAIEAIKRSSKEIDEFYKIICGHPYYGFLEITVKPKNVRGRIKNSYQIEAYNPKGRKTSISTRLSTGQMNSAALAIYLALSKALSHKIGFLILDDPSQSMDEVHKKNLITVLKDISSNNQVIISTHDIEFQDMLTSNLKTEQRHIYKFQKWTTSGPTIK